MSFEIKQLLIATVLISTVCPASAKSAEVPHGTNDMLCAKAPAGTVVAVPAMVSKWATVICTPHGQAIAVMVTNKVITWTKHGTGQTFMLFANWDEETLANAASSYDLRFTRMAAIERTGIVLEKSLRMWELAFGQPRSPAIDRVVQLDAANNDNRTIQNLFFYIVDGKPRWIMACRDKCAQSVALDVTYY